MAALTLPKSHKPRRRSKLQALLLSGGAFVLAVTAWFFATHRLVVDPEAILGDRVLGAMTFIGRPARSEAFIAALPEEAQSLLKHAPLANEGRTTIFAYRDIGNALRWAMITESSRLSSTSAESQNPQKSLVEGPELPFHLKSFGPADHQKTLVLSANAQPEETHQPARRWIKRGTQAFGFLMIDGQHQPLSVSFGPESFSLKIGRTYRGVAFSPFTFETGRRLQAPFPHQAAYLEKPAGVSWERLAASFKKQLQRFEALTEPWSWPGRVELAVSASSTWEALQPFTLYHHPVFEEPDQNDRYLEFAKNLFSSAVPEEISVTLPDASRMTELRNDPEALRTTTVTTQVGKVTKISSPRTSAVISVFASDTGENWISSDLAWLQAEIISNIGQKYTNQSCQEGGPAGTAAFSGKIFKEFGSFSFVNLQLFNVETGMFTICGYY